MRFITPREFKADRAWGSLPIASMNGVTAKLHWGLSWPQTATPKRAPPASAS